MGIILELLDFVNKGQVSEWLHHAETRLGREEVRLLAIKLLGWLKSRNRFQRNRPLALNKHRPWCRELVDWLTHDERLASLFSASEDSFDFRDDVPEELRRAIWAKVDAEYSPRLRT